MRKLAMKKGLENACLRLIANANIHVILLQQLQFKQFEQFFRKTEAKI